MRPGPQGLWCAALLVAGGWFSSRARGAEPTGPSAYEGLMAEARAAFKQGRHQEAATKCARALRVTEEPRRAPGARTVEAQRLWAQVELAKGRPKKALLHAKAAAQAALHAPRLRRKLLMTRLRIAQNAKLRRDVKTTQRLMDGDAYLQAVMRRPRRALQDLDGVRKRLAEVEAAYVTDGDRGFVALTRVLRARILVQAEDTVDEGLAQLKRLVTARYPPRIRVLALKARHRGYTVKDQVDKAVRAAIRSNQLEYESLPPEKRRYARNRAMREACARYEDQRGPDACVKLERRLTKAVTYDDYASMRRAPKRTAQDIDRVHQKLLIVLQWCVLGRARADPERFENVEVRFAWSIDRDGRPRQINVQPSRYQEDLQPCIDDPIAHFRYPRVRSRERMHVTVPYRLD